MTTTAPAATPFTGVRLIVGAAAVVTATGLLLAGAAALISGRGSDVLGALLGTLVVVLVFGLGLSSVNLVSRVMPAASLLVALLTYTLQVVALFLVFWAFTEASWWGSEVTPGWVAGGVVLGCLTWMVAQVIFFVRARIPVFEVSAR